MITHMKVHLRFSHEDIHMCMSIKVQDNDHLHEVRYSHYYGVHIGVHIRVHMYVFI